MASEEILISALLLSCLRSALPLILAALGGLISERSGIVQLGLEGQMLFGALAAAIVTYFSQSPWIGLTAGVLASSAIALLMGVFIIWLKADQIIVGTAINLFVIGLAPFLTKLYFDSTGSTPNIPLEIRFQAAPFYITLFLCISTFYLFKFTKIGVNLRFAGESPMALQASGVSYNQVRWISLLGCGSLCGFAGSFLSLYLASSYSPLMTAGRGFIALSAVVFGAWNPGLTILVCLGFSFVDSLASVFQGSNLIAVQFIQIVPYVFTLFAVGLGIRRSRAPQYLGKNEY